VITVFTIDSIAAEIRVIRVDGKQRSDRFAPVGRGVRRE
jgi:hypothetical protein